MKTVADYPRAIKKAIETLSDAGVKFFPLDLNVIHERYSNMYEIRTYADFMEETGISRQDCINFFKSKDGATQSNGTTKCTIYYNELETNSQRLRFTLAHEIGHVMLDHVFDYDECTEEEQNLLEKEANCFAGNLLCPACFVLQIFKEHGIEKQEFDSTNNCYRWYVPEEKITIGRRIESRYSPEELLQINFDISHDAAAARLNLLAIDIKNSYDTRLGISYIPILDARLTAKWRCTHCQTEKLPGALYCSGCGRKAIFQYCTEPAIEYRHRIASTKGMYDICPVCGNMVFSHEALFCMVCGSPRQNYCASNKNHQNHPQAKFCKQCGNETVYSRLNLSGLVANTLAQETYIMSYKDMEEEDNGIPERCPLCNHFTYGFKKVCDCGFNLENKCVVCARHNSANARYCEYCGGHTTFYIENILNDWRKPSQDTE